MMLPPGRSLCLALEYSDEAREDLRREILRIRQTVGDASKTRIYFHRAGTYFRQDRDQDFIDPRDPSYGEPVAPTGFWYSDPESGSQLPPVAAEFVAWLEQVMPLCPPVPLDQRSLGDRGDRMLLVHSSHMNFRFRRVDSIPDDLLWEPSWYGSGPLVDINQNHPLMKIAVRNGCSQCVALVEEILLELGVEEASVFEETAEHSLADLRLRLSRNLRNWVNESATENPDA